MKQLLMIIVAIVISISSYAQPVTANEMLEMLQCTSPHCLETKLLPKGYEAGATNETEDYSVYEYYSKTSEPYDDNERVILPNQLQYSITGDTYIITDNFVPGISAFMYISLSSSPVFLSSGTITKPTFLKSFSIASKFTLLPVTKLTVTIYHKVKNEQKYTEYGFKLNRMTDPPRTELEAHKEKFPPKE